MITTNGADQQLGFFLGENDINPSYEAAEKKFVKPESLMPGDYIRVTLSNGVTSEGIYSFSGPRVCVPYLTHFYERKVYYSRNGKVDVGIREFAEFTDQASVELLEANFVPNYQLPSKDNVLEELMNELKQVPLNERIDAYRSFGEAYPKYEVSWSKLIKEAWDKAIVAVTSVEEVEALIRSKKDVGQNTYDPGVKDYLDRIFKNANPSKRAQALDSLVWTKEFVSPATQKTTHRIAVKFSHINMLSPVYAKLLEVTNDKKLFHRTLDNLGIYSPVIEELNLEKNYAKIEKKNNQDRKVDIWIKKSFLEKK